MKKNTKKNKILRKKRMVHSKRKYKYTKRRKNYFGGANKPQPLDRLTYGVDIAASDTTYGGYYDKAPAHNGLQESHVNFIPQYLPNIQSGHKYFDTLEQIKKDYGIVTKCGFFNSKQDNIPIKLRFYQDNYIFDFKAKLSTINDYLLLPVTKDVWCKATFADENNWKVTSQITNGYLYSTTPGNEGMSSNDTIKNTMTYFYNGNPIFEIFCERFFQQPDYNLTVAINRV
jgi:hypothetical protein